MWMFLPLSCDKMLFIVRVSSGLTVPMKNNTCFSSNKYLLFQKWLNWRDIISVSCPAEPSHLSMLFSTVLIPVTQGLTCVIRIMFSKRRQPCNDSGKTALVYKVLNKHTPTNMGPCVQHISTSRANYVHIIILHFIPWDKSNVNETPKECPAVVTYK